MDHQPQHGDLNWRLSAQPLTLLSFLAFRIGMSSSSSSSAPSFLLPPLSAGLATGWVDGLLARVLG